MMRVAEMDRAEEEQGLWTRVCPLAEIVPNTGVCCLAGSRQVAVFRLEDGRVFAIGNYDPFSKANVLSRGIVGDRNGRAKVASPIYKQSFCLATGECLDDPSVSVLAYEVRVRDEIVEVKEPITRPLRTGNSSLLSELQRV
ncbi:MAG TPA: nitrite reductase small subunit NirD [Polyangiaceae bacterium]|nr:nitrite reductase small subunit NirD [Polyangiaceae bacterium]